MATALYTRQSLDKKDSLSIEGQINLYKKECADDEHLLIFRKIVFSELTNEEKHMVVESFVEKVIIGANEIEIVWKI